MLSAIRDLPGFAVGEWMVTFPHAVTLCTAPDHVHPANAASQVQGLQTLTCLEG